MKLIKYPSEEVVEEAIENDEPLLMIISFDGETAYISPIDEAVEHHILLNKLGLPYIDIDKYFRIVLDKSGADWTFVCPSDYKKISDKYRRITKFYNDGFNIISNALIEIGYIVGINIPKRYRRHIDELKNNG